MVDLAEATRQYQACLEHRRVAHDRDDTEDIAALDETCERMRQGLETVWLEHVFQGAR